MGENQIEIQGVLLSPVKKVNHEKGDIFHIMRSFDEGYNGFGEVYISNIKFHQIKAWKRHLKMTSNMVVPIGAVKIVIFDDRPDSETKGIFNEFILSINDYSRLTIPPNVLYGFTGLEDGANMIINVADISHDPKEQINYSKDYVKYNW